MILSNKKIYLNDILNFNSLTGVKIRFNLMLDGNWNPIEIFKNNELDVLLKGQYWNYKMKKSFKEGDTTIGFVRINPKDNLYLLFHVGKITKDLDKRDGVGYEYIVLEEFEKYFGRLIIRFKNTAQTMIRNAESVINNCEIVKILPDIFDNDIFPGYERVNVSWSELSRVIEKETWKTALQNQKGVYLITDVSNGKMYVGAAYGEDMILNRWRAYTKSGHGGNVELKNLDFDHIKSCFRYTILDIFKSSIDTQVIREKETWWKNILLTRKFGYNKN